MKRDTPVKSRPLEAPRKGKLRENIEALVIAIILALFIRVFVVQAFTIPSGSMKNTLLIGDYIMVNKFIFGIKVPFTQITAIPIKNPQKGDIVVFRYPLDPSKDFIKRVVAVAGDTVEIRRKKVYINGKPQESEFAVHSDWRTYSNPRKSPQSFIMRDNLAPKKIPEGKLFVMGDNRDESNDSRFWGLVDLSAVRGKAFMIYWSWDNHKKFGVRWERLGDFIH